MKKIIYSLLVLVLIIGTGCKKSFFDINQSPNDATDASITAEMICPRVEHIVGARMATSYDVMARWCGYWTRSGTYGPTQEEESYNITSNFQTTQWSAWYNILTDVNIMEKKAKASGQGYYEGIAKTLKSIGFMYLVDMYGKVPYKEAFDLGNHILPAYDKGEDIYADLLVQLEEAAELFRTSSASASPNITSADVIFKGDAEMWRKLINTQKLKLLLRQAKVAGFSATAEIAKITADGSGFLGSGETAEVQPGYVQDLNKQNPFWNAYKLDYTGANDPDQYNSANNYVLNKMKGSSDVRYTYCFAKVKEKSSTTTPPQLLDYYGYNYGENIANGAPKAVNASKVSGPGLAISPTQAQWLFTSTESLFLQAEAIARGWIAGDAKTAYEKAVTESFIWLGVTDAEVEASFYLDQDNSLVKWDAAASVDQKVSLIVMQKYLALVGVNNFEAWVDYRRLGVPSDLPMSMSPNRESRHVPYRLRYPQSEINYNAKNVTAAGDDDPQTVKIFWDVD